MTEEKDVTVIELGKKVLKLYIKGFDENEIPVEDLLQIDMNNLFADIITWPVVLNRIANMKAEIDEQVQLMKLELDIFESNKYESVKKEMIAMDIKPTETSLKMAITKSKEYLDRQVAIIAAQKQADIVAGFYLSAKSKDKKLEVISVKIKPEDFEQEILVKSINSVMIKSINNDLQDLSKKGLRN